jgi:hypothetical protein
MSDPRRQLEYFRVFLGPRADRAVDAPAFLKVVREGFHPVMVMPDRMPDSIGMQLAHQGRVGKPVMDERMGKAARPPVTSPRAGSRHPVEFLRRIGFSRNAESKKGRAETKNRDPEDWCVIVAPKIESISRQPWPERAANRDAGHETA